MKIAVTDACIFIDLIELDLVSTFFQLHVELHTTVDVINELYSDQKQLLQAYEVVNKLYVHNLDAGDFSKMGSIPFPRGLSHQDKSVIYLALTLKNAIVLSSDKLVRIFAEKQGLECHGLLWIIDELVDQDLVYKDLAASILQRLVSSNSMYSTPTVRKEVDNRVQAWRRKNDPTR